MDEIAAYFRDKIERALSFYETRISGITPAYLAQVEKLAKRTEDPVLADHYRKTVRPDRIESAVADIRRQLEMGLIREADRALDRLKVNLELLESHLKHPFFRTGAKQRRFLDSGRTEINEKRKRGANQRHRKWALEAQNAWKHNPRLTVSACAIHLIAKFKLNARPKTVADAIRNFQPKKVGGAG
jgi:hypothetical protein